MPRGATVWLTGLPASGKTTVARALEAQLALSGRTVSVLDGDEVRRGLCADLGYSAADRDENVRRVADAARLVAESGAIAIVALVSPYRAARAGARALHEEAGLPFVEVWVSTPLEICEARDPKGLYARARSGTLDHLTGVSDPYEPPEAPDADVQPGVEPLQQVVARVLRRLA